MHDASLFSHVSKNSIRGYTPAIMDIHIYLDIFIYFNLVFRACESVLIGDDVDDTRRYVPPSFVDQCPPQDLSQSYTVPPGRNYVTIKWTEPIAIDQFGKKLRVEQVLGVKNGGQFTGSVDFERHHIVYIVTDSNGLKDNCYFVIDVQIPECPSLGIIDNGQYKCTDGSSPGSSCLLNCSKGYIENKTGNITCDYTLDSVQANPTWSDSQQCGILNCSKPTVPENADISCTDTDNSYLSVCFIQCRQGYTSIGPLYIICMADGIWSRPTRCLANLAFEQQCSSLQCNGHTCILGVNQEIHCYCSNGWSGRTCEIPPDYCRDNVCMNNASCVNHYLGYNCTCPQYYSGVLCQISPVDGYWSDWTVWSSCSRSCGSGKQTRFRLCNSPSPGPGGRLCKGKGMDSIPCSFSKCKICPYLKQYNGSQSNYSCETYDNYGQEKCQTVCESGTVLPPQFEHVREIFCGWPTNNDWIPGNIQPTCVAPVPPKGLRLETSISYEKRIPNDKEDAFKQEVLDHLRPTDCFTSTKIRCDASLTFSIILSQTGIVISKLIVFFQITLDTVIRKRSTGLDDTDLDSSLEEARHVIEMTADFVKNFTADIFDIRLEETEFIADKNSLNMSISVDCGDGTVPNDGKCVVCPAGCYITNEKCEFCGKGFYQERPGQTECKPCPDGYTTFLPGAVYPFECAEPVVNTLDKTKDIVIIVVSVVTPIVSLIIATPTFVKMYYKCREQRRINTYGEPTTCPDDTLRFNRGRELKLTKEDIEKIEADFKVRPSRQQQTGAQNCLAYEIATSFITGNDVILSAPLYSMRLVYIDEEVKIDCEITVGNVLQYRVFRLQYRIFKMEDYLWKRVDVSEVPDIHVNIKNIDISEAPDGTDRPVGNVIDKILKSAEDKGQGTIAIPPLIKQGHLIEWEAKDILQTVNDYFKMSDTTCIKCHGDNNTTICNECGGGSKLKTIIIVLPSYDNNTVNIYRDVFEKLRKKHKISSLSIQID